MNAGDPEVFVSCFAEDGIQMPPNFPGNVGKAAIRQWIQFILSQFECQFSLSVDEVRVAADWGFERGRYSLGLKPKAGGGPIHDSGKYITIYARQSDGSWKIARDIWNSDLPMPGGS